ALDRRANWASVPPPPATWVDRQGWSDDSNRVRFSKPRSIQSGKCVAVFTYRVHSSSLRRLRTASAGSIQSFSFCADTSRYLSFVINLCVRMSLFTGISVLRHCIYPSLLHCLSCFTALPEPD